MPEPASAAEASVFDFDYWNTTVWLVIRVTIARWLAAIPVVVFASGFQAILQRLGYVAPLLPSKPASLREAAGPALIAVLLLAASTAAPAVWVWPIGRYLDRRDESLRAKALGRFTRINWFFLIFIGVQHACAALMDRTAGGVLLALFNGYYAVYFTLLAIEPLLFKDLARWLYVGEALYERKPGPMLGVRTKLLLLVANLIVIPMALVGVSMRLGLTGYSQGLGVAILTAVIAVGYIEMLYQSLSLPLTALNEKMSRVAQGDFGAKTSVLADDEIGELKAHYNEMVDGLAERERLKDTFGRFVSVEIAKRLIGSNEVVLGGESVEATVLFSDIRDFTPLSETLSPQDLVSFLNHYFSFVTEPITEHRGVVNKFIGDAVMAVFTPHFGSIDHAEDALAAALAMRRKLAQFNAERAAAGAPPVRAGIGIHTGLLIAGNIGTEKRMEYTVIGDTVNIAARIESQTKELSTDILVSESVYSRLGETARASAAARRLENVRVKGKAAPLVLYKIG